MKKYFVAGAVMFCVFFAMTASANTAKITAFSAKDFNSQNRSVTLVWNASGPIDTDLEVTCTPGSVQLKTDKGNNPICEKGGIWSWSDQKDGSIIVYVTGNKNPLKLDFSLNKSGDEYSKAWHEAVAIPSDPNYTGGAVSSDQTSDQTIATLRAQIERLLAVIAQLKNGVKPADSTDSGHENPFFGDSKPTACGNPFSTLKLGSQENRKDDVTRLQQFLVKNGFMKSVTGTFDEDTVAALKAFQTKNGIEATGTFGPITRGKLNAFFCPTKPIDLVVPSTGDTSTPGDFSGVKMISPVGGENWLIGRTYTIQYNAKNSGADGQVRVYLTRDYPSDSSKKGINSSVLIGTTDDSQNFTYTVSANNVIGLGGTGSGFRIEICADSSCSIRGLSPYTFSIGGTDTGSVSHGANTGVSIYAINGIQMSRVKDLYENKPIITIPADSGSLALASAQIGNPNVCEVNATNTTTGKSVVKKLFGGLGGLTFLTMPDGSEGDLVSVTLSCANNGEKVGSDSAFIKLGQSYQYSL